MKTQLDHNTQSFLLELTPSGTGYTVTLDGETYPFEILHSENGRLRIRLSASESVPASAPSSVPLSAPIFTAQVSVDGPKRWVTVNGRTFVLTKPAGTGKRGGHGAHAAGELVAPMPGQVRTVQVAAGETVARGQTLVIVEAMKMEIKIAAPRDGVVKALKIRPGQTVDRDQLLVELE